MKALCVILGVISASALGLQVNVEGDICKFSPWECDEFTDFVDDASSSTHNSVKVSPTEHSISQQSENRGNSKLVCPSFDQPDLDALELRAKQGPVQVKPNSVKDRSTKTPKRILLFILMAPYTGSTGISSFLATSPQLSTLCGGGTWACEGTWILTEMPKSGPLMTIGTRWAPDKPKDWKEAVHIYSSIWNMSQRVMMDKSPPNIAKAKSIYDQLKNTGEEVKFIMVTRSPCLAKGAQGHRDRDIADMRMMIQARRDLDDDSLLHLRYEDVIRDPYASASKILDFLPELVSIDPSQYGLERVFQNRSLSLMDYIRAHGQFENFHAKQQMDMEWEEFVKTFKHDAS